MLIEASDFRS